MLDLGYRVEWEQKEAEEVINCEKKIHLFGAFSFMELEPMTIMFGRMEAGKSTGSSHLEIQPQDRKTPKADSL